MKVRNKTIGEAFFSDVLIPSGTNVKIRVKYISSDKTVDRDT